MVKPDGQIKVIQAAGQVTQCHALNKIPYRIRNKIM